jgi:hypothetical protein
LYTKQRSIARALVAIVLACVLLPGAAGAQNPLRGTVVDKDTADPIAFVAVTLDSTQTQYSTDDGTFNFGTVARGSHVLSFHHISFKSHSVTIRWSSRSDPLVVELEPSQFEADKIVVTGTQDVQSLPVSSISISRAEVTTTAGNIANDPLRTVQSQPSCATSGIDFLSEMAVRGGDSEEHRVYFDGYPLNHYAHVGGFAGVVYDDLLESTVLVPGAAPIQYTGNLSGVILLKPARPDSSFRSFRYDITSMAGGVGQVITPSLAIQASAKTSFFNLPVYQQQGVKDRSFRDFMGRAVFSPGESFRATATFMAATDSETGNYWSAPGQKREVKSALAGLDLSYRRSGWEVNLRPSWSRFDSRDALSWRYQPREHDLEEVGLLAGLTRRGKVFGIDLSGGAGRVRHSGNGGDHSDTPYSASAEMRLMHRDAAALVLGVGGSKEPWTAKFEPEAYGSARIALWDLITVSGGVRRSHQSPFVFTQRRYFASLPIDAGDLLGEYAPSWHDAPAVRMDQASAGATLSLPFLFGVEFTGYRRWYENLLTGEWDAFPGFTNVQSGGTGHGFGYEVALTRHDPEFLSFMIAASRARVWKTEGTLTAERIGDFDRPDSWHVGASLKLGDGFWISARWMDVYGRPYTLYRRTTTPPSTDEVNAVRLPRFQRLDVKFVISIARGDFDGEFFVDMVNIRNRRNLAMMYALESSPGEFESVPYGGAKFFPIAGITVRW